MSFVIIDDDGTELSSPETDSNGRNSKSDTDNDFEEVYVDSKETRDNNDSPSSSNEFINIKNDVVEVYGESLAERSKKSTPRAVTTKTTTKSFGSNGGGSGAAVAAAKGNVKKENTGCEKVTQENLNLFSETPLLLGNSKKREKMIDDMLRLYNNFALSNMSDACFRDSSVSKKLLEPYRNCLDNFDEGLAAGYIAALSGNLDRLLENSLSEYLPFSKNISETLEHFDDLMKTISSIPMSEFDSGLLHYSIAKFYQCVGDIFSARFASGDFNKDNREKLCIYSAACYIISLQYLEEAKFGSRKTRGSMLLSICEMKISLTYSLNYYNNEMELTELLKDIKLGNKLAHALWTEKESNEKIEKTFLALNKVDYFDYTVIPKFDFQTDFVNNLGCIWELHSVEGFLDHLLFIIGYGRVTDYLFLGKVLSNIKHEKLNDNDLTSQIDLFDVFLTLVTFAIDYCQISNYKFGYDYSFRQFLGLPQTDINFISPKKIDHSIIVSVARHGRPPLYATLFWKAIQILGRDSSPQSRKALIEKNFRSEAAFREILSNAVNEVNVKNDIHNFYVVSERFHLMLIWYIYNGFGDSEMSYVHHRLASHVEYLEKVIKNETFTFNENEVDNAERKGGILSQLFPKKNLYWLVYPSSKNCEYLSVKSVQEVIAHYYAYTYGRESAEGKKYWDLLSSDYKTILLPPIESPEEPEADLPEMSDIPETAKIVHSPYKDEQTININLPPIVPNEPTTSIVEENKEVNNNEYKKALIELSQEMEKEREKFQETTDTSIAWSSIIEKCNSSAITFDTSNKFEKEYLELQKMVEEQKEALLKKTFAKFVINDKHNDDISVLILKEIELKVAEFEARETQAWKVYTDLINSLRNDPLYSCLKDITVRNIQENGASIKLLTAGLVNSSLPQQNIPQTYPPSMQMSKVNSYQAMPQPPLNPSFPCSPQDLFRYRFEEAQRIMNNFVGFNVTQQAIILSQIAYATGNWSLEQKQQYDTAQLNHHFNTTGTPCPPFPDLSMIRHLLQPIFQPPPPSNPFKNNPLPRGFLTNALAQQSLKFGSTIPSQDPYNATTTNLSNTSQTFPPHRPLTQQKDLNLPSTSQHSTLSDIINDSPNKPVSSENFFPTLSSPKTDGKEGAAATASGESTLTVNEAFRLAFEHWRGISADTPEEIRMQAVAPSLTPREIAQYKPTINIKIETTDNDDLLFPPRAGETHAHEEVYDEENEEFYVSDESDSDDDDDEYPPDEDYSNEVDTVGNEDEEEEEENDNYDDDDKDGSIPIPSFPLSNPSGASDETAKGSYATEEEEEEKDDNDTD